jgi:hypothetical protein
MIAAAQRRDRIADDMRFQILPLVCAIAIAVSIPVSIPGCLRVGQASDDEKQQLAAWSAVVTDKDRAEVQRTASLHTEWMEKKQVQWMIQQYKTRYAHLQSKSATKPTTQTTQPTTDATTHPTTNPFGF